MSSLKLKFVGEVTSLKMLSLLTNLGGAQEEHNEADRRGVGSYLEMAKEVAAEAFEEGYAACLRKLAEAGANFSG